MILKGKIALVTFRFLWNCEFILSFCAILPFASLRMKLTCLLEKLKQTVLLVQEGCGYNH